MSSDWEALADWWVQEVRDDPAYASDVHPILLELLPEDLGVGMDLGCGEGQGMRLVGSDVFGCDLSVGLLARSGLVGRVVRTRLPDLGWLAESVLDTAFSIYLLDLIEDHDRFFEETARVVGEGGALVIVINHPVYTAPGSAPLADVDGEVLWRWGSYFTEGSGTEPAGPESVEFFHRPLGALLSAAARHGWILDRLIERGLSPETVERIPSYQGQEEIPRLLGVRWRAR